MFNEYFKSKAPIADKLISFGFQKQADVFSYSTNILDDQFSLEITINQNGEVGTKLIDTFTQDLYTLHLVEDAQGAYIGEIRQVIGDILEKISKECFRPQVFKSDVTQALISYASQKYGAPLEFLWEKFDNNAVMRRQDNDKWFALFVSIQKSKLGIQTDDTRIQSNGVKVHTDSLVEILVARISPNDVDDALSKRGYLPAYHMNKKNWITILLDGSVPYDEVFSRLDDSFLLAKKK